MLLFVLFLREFFKFVLRKVLNCVIISFKTSVEKSRFIYIYMIFTSCTNMKFMGVYM